MADFIDPYEIENDETSFVDPYEDPTKKSSTELDLIALEERRQKQDDESVLKALLEQAGPELTMDGQPFNINNMTESGNSPKTIMDFITSGTVVDSRIDSIGKSIAAAVPYGFTNILGMPGDLVNMAAQGGETVVRKGSNYLASLNAPEGVDDPTSENYDPDFYLSENKNDFLLSRPVAPFGGQDIRNKFEAATQFAVDPVLNRAAEELNSVLGTELPTDIESTYIDSKYEVPKDFRAPFEATRVVTENALPAFSLLRAAKAGFGIANGFFQTIRENAKRFVKTEVAATGTAASLVSGAELAGLNDNPWVSMGLEFTGAIIGGNASNIKNGLQNGTQKVAGNLTESFLTLFSDTAASRVAINKILIAADTQRLDLLKQVDAAKIAGNEARVAELTLLADAHTPQRILQDLQDSLPRKVDANGVFFGEEGFDASTATMKATDPAKSALPIGELTGNPALIAIQNKMLSDSPQLQGNVANQVNAALSELLNTSEVLARSGNLEAAATVRASYFQELLNVKIAGIRAEAEARVNALGGEVSPTAASAVAQEVIFKAKDNIRSMETYLWERIDGTITMSGNIMANKINLLKKNRILPTQTLSGGAGQLENTIEYIFAKASDPAQSLTVQELRIFRSNMLSNARQAAGDNNFTQAGIFDELASAAIDELNTIPRNLGGANYIAANRFSAELNKRFSRYFNQEVLSSEATGGTTIRPEEVLDEATSGTPNDRAASMAELREGAEFSDTMGPRVNTIKEEDLVKEFEKWSIGSDPADATTTGTDLARVLRMDPSEIPSSTDNIFRTKMVDDLEAFAKEMEEVGSLELAKEARLRAKLFKNYKGPNGEDFFDPSNKGDNPEFVENAGETFEDFLNPTAKVEEPEFKINEGGQTSNVPSLLGDSVTVDLLPIMTKAQEDFLRGSASKLKNTDNTISVEKLEKFMSATENSEVLKAFPSFRAELTGLLDAQRNLDQVIQRFDKIATTGKLPAAIDEVLSSSNPVEDFTILSREAITPEAMADFRTSAMDTLFAKSRQDDGSPNFFIMANELTRPLSGKKGDISILELMENTGVISTSDKVIVSEAMALGVEIQKRSMNPTQLNDVLTDNGDLVNNVARIFGANFGARFGVGEGSQLQAAAIGSAAFKKIVSGLPLANQKRQAELMILQPDLAMKVLSENPKIRRGAIHAFKEWGKNYADTFRGLSRTAAVTKGTLDLTAGAAIGAGNLIGDAVISAPVATGSALTGNVQDEERPTVETQMQGAFQ